MAVFAPIGWHVTLRLDRDHDRVIATTVGQVRTAADRFLRLGRRFGLLAFGVADTHMHALLACDRPAAGRFVHDLEVSLRHHLELPIPFAPARFTPVETQRHLRDSLRYVFGQDDPHGLQRDPFREGTNLPDLLGARTEGCWTAAGFARLMPRVGRPELLRYMPWGPDLELPAPTSALDLLPEAGAAVALVPELTGRPEPVVATRRAAVHLAVPHLGPARTARLLSIGRSSVHRLLRQPADPARVRALTLQVRMRQASATAGRALPSDWPSPPPPGPGPRWPGRRR